MLGLVILSALSCVAALVSGETAAQHEQAVVCYVATWSVYRPAKGQFTLDNVDPHLCTHVVYAFVGIDDKTFAIKSLDPEFDINKGGFKKAAQLKRLNPKLKVTIAVGGWVEGSEKYSNMSATVNTRGAFINSALDFIKQYNFDGLDLDWEYPANRGGRPEDKENFVQLAKELRDVFQPYGWILTAAVASSKSVAETAYDIPRLSQYLDLIHLMAYDYHGKWDGKTGHNSPLYPRADESQLEQLLNVNHSVRYYIQSGAPVEKFVLGLGLYGRTFLLNSTANPGIGAPALKTAFAGPYTREDGFLGYNEICEKQIGERGWSIAWQRAHQAPYMFKDNMWVSFDDVNSLGLKVAFAQRLGLAGVMAWSLDTDDFSGSCTGTKFPLLKSINKNLVLHAPERFQEKIKVLPTTPKPKTTIRPIRPDTLGIPLPTLPDVVHQPGISRPEDRPGSPPTRVPGISRPEVQPGVPGISRPEIQPGVPGISRPEVQPGVPGIPLPGLPTIDPHKPGVHIPDYGTPGVYLPDPQDGGHPGVIIYDPLQPIDTPSVDYHPGVFQPETPGLYYPDVYDDLDDRKPTRTEIDFDVDDDNDVDTRRHRPSGSRGRRPIESGSEMLIFAPFTLLLTTALAFLFSH